MQTKIQHVFRSASPYRVLVDLSIPVKKKGDVFVAPNPVYPKVEMLVGETELVSLAFNAEFFAGSAFDYLVTYFAGDVERAVDFVIERYGHSVETQSEYSLSQLRSRYVDDIKYRRRLFNTLFCLRDNLNNQPGKHVLARAWLRRNGVDLERCHRMIYAVTGEELSTLLHLTQNADLVEFDVNDHYVVFPFFANYSTYSMLRVCRVRDNQWSTVPITPSRVAYFGLHTADPRGGDIRIFRDPFQAAQSFCALAGVVKSGFGCVSTHFSTSTETHGTVFNKACYVTAENSDFSHMVRTRLLFDSFSVSEAAANTFGHTQLPSLEWNSFVCHKFRKFFNDSGSKFTAPINVFLDSLRPDKTAINMLASSLDASNLPQAAQAVRNATKSNAVWTFDKLTIEETPNGYVARKVGTPGEHKISNFIVRIDHSVWFEQSKDMYHSGRLIMGDRDYPIHISRRVLDKATDLLRPLEDVVNTTSRGQDPIPDIYDTSYRVRIASIIKSQADPQPRLQGVERLGWDRNNHVFVSPKWRASVHGVTSTSMLLHPASPLREAYSFQISRMTDDETLVTPQQRTFLAMLIAMLARDFAKLPSPIVRIQDSIESRRLLFALFVTFGQQRVYEINPNLRGGMPVLDRAIFTGFPMIASCANEPVLAELDYPLFLLSRSGLAFSESIDQPTFNQLYSYAHRVVQTCATGILREPTDFFRTLLPATPSTAQLVTEGKQLIEKFTGKAYDVFELDMPVFRALLSSIPYDELPKFFRFDLLHQKVFINFRRVTNYRRRDVLPELVKIDADAKFYQEHYITISPDIVLNLLEKFYGRPAPLRHAPEFPDQETPTPEETDTAAEA